MPEHETLTDRLVVALIVFPVAVAAWAALRTAEAIAGLKSSRRSSRGSSWKAVNRARHVGLVLGARANADKSGVGGTGNAGEAS